MNQTLAHPPITVYGIFPFDRGGKARWLLTEMDVPFENHWLNRETGEANEPAYLEINPMGRVPAIKIGKTALFESAAICAYLADLYLDRGLAPALDSPARAEYQKWMYFTAATIDTFQTRIMIIEDIPAGEVQKNKEAELKTEFRDALHTLHLTLSKNSFLVGTRFSAADIGVAYALYFCRLWPEFESILTDFPSVMSYLERLQAMPSAKKSEVFSYTP
jgi:glutathione S-transferase